MTVTYSQPIKNNYVIDASGIGVKTFEYDANEIQHMIGLDITSNYDCITYYNSQVNVEDDIYIATNTLNNSQVDIKIYFKVCTCDDADQMLAIITNYLTTTFLKQ